MDDEVILETGYGALRVYVFDRSCRNLVAPAKTLEINVTLSGHPLGTGRNNVDLLVSRFLEA